MCIRDSSIIEKAGKIYTQIKIDEITNLGTVKVRLRSPVSYTHLEKAAFPWQRLFDCHIETKCSAAEVKLN